MFLEGSVQETAPSFSPISIFRRTHHLQHVAETLCSCIWCRWGCIWMKRGHSQNTRILPKQASAPKSHPSFWRLQGWNVFMQENDPGSSNQMARCPRICCSCIWNKNLSFIVQFLRIENTGSRVFVEACFVSTWQPIEVFNPGYTAIQMSGLSQRVRPKCWQSPTRTVHHTRNQWREQECSASPSSSVLAGSSPSKVQICVCWMFEQRA